MTPRTGGRAEETGKIARSAGSAADTGFPRKIGCHPQRGLRAATESYKPSLVGRLSIKPGRPDDTNMKGPAP
jgi:hypothetical protein